MIFSQFLNRNFIAKNYSSLKAQNPNFPLIVRECEEADPYVIARYCKCYQKQAKFIVSDNNFIFKRVWS